MRGMVTIGTLVLLACTDKAAEAEKQYEMVKRGGGTPAELCQRMRAVADAHLEAQNEKQYQDWKLYADIQCQSAELEARLGL